MQETFWKGHILKKWSVLVVFSRSYTKKKENLQHLLSWVLPSEPTRP